MNSSIVRYVGLGMVFASAVAEAQANRALEAGDRAPVFSITTDRGRHIDSSTLSRGILVVNFWETSCAPCIAELPSLSVFARQFPADQVTVVSISGDEDAVQYGRFLRDRKIALETYRDPSRCISKSFGTFQFPETYLIQNGRIVRKVVGGIDWMNQDMSTFVHNLLAPVTRR